MKGFILRASATEPSLPSFLPDFCANRAVFLVVLIAELLVLILVLSTAHAFQDFWLDLALLSLFIQWIALGSAAALCFSVRWIARLSIAPATLLAYGLTQLVTLLFSLLALRVTHGYGLQLGGDQPLPFLLRTLAISSIVSLAALRYFYVQQQWRQNVEAEARARLVALQARIRPHFLFNSMNTIVSLIRSRPEQAEQAVVDLAGLLRATLEQKDNSSLAEELDITRRYLRIEALRLGERLQVDWQLDEELPLATALPALILQPLVENAIYHGIQPRTEGGCVTIQIKVHDKRAQVTISNPLPAAKPSGLQEGNRIAQDNIRQRLTLAYGEENLMTIRSNADYYSVSFQIPVERAL